MSAHQQVLEIVERTWIDMGGGRRSLAKRKLPPHAHSPSPCVIVEALPADLRPDDVSAQFLARSWSPRFNHAHVPTMLAWHVVSPADERFFIVYWINWKRNTVTLFEKFCDETGRAHGRLTPDRMIDFGTRKISFFDCRLVHENEIRPQQRTIHRTAAGRRDIVATARGLLQAATPGIEELESEEFRNDAAAHDDELHARLRRKFERRLQAVQKQLAAEFGAPDETGSEAPHEIPCSGVFRFAVWRRLGKPLFVAALHEDRELPCVLVIGTL